MRVLFVTYGTSESAATRYRAEQYFPYLREEGVLYTCMSMISSSLTRSLIKSYSPGGLLKGIWVLCEQVIGFFRVALRAPWYDVVFFQRAVFPFGLEKIVRILNKNIVYDLDDAIHMPVAKDGGILWRLKGAIKGREVERVLSVSRHCICENNYIKTYVKNFCPRVSIITGPIDAKRNFVSEKAGGPLTIGWVGSPATSAYLGIIHVPLRELAKRHYFQVKLIGVKGYGIDKVNVISNDWSYDTEVGEIQSFDIGICPMPDDEWTRGKVSVKILQYMANGIPTLASYTPTNKEVIGDGDNGFIAHNEGEWVEKLSRLISEPGLRRTIGLRGRKTVEERYSLENNSRVLVGILRDIARH